MVVMEKTPRARPPASEARTPMMKQYLAFKEAHPGEILFFRMGDFYEMFFEDAETVSRVLGLRLTARGSGEDAHAMAGIPHHAVDRYLPQLIEQGYRVAICDQVQDPKEVKAGQIVERAIVDIVTPGTITDERFLPPDASNYVLMVARRRRSLGLAWLDVSTGRFFVMDLPASASLLRAEIQRIGPRELLITDKVQLAGGREQPTTADLIARDEDLAHAVRGLGEVMVTTVPDWTADKTSALEELCAHYEVGSLAGFGLDDGAASSAAAGALLAYARRMKAGQLGKLRPPLPYRIDDFVRLDGATLRCLEVVAAMRSQDRRATLNGALDRTQTAMGARLLRDWLLSPLMDRAAIEARLDCVAVLREDAIALASLREQLRGVYDIERLAQKVSSGRADARDLANLRDSLARLPEVARVCRDATEGATAPNEAFARLCAGLGDHGELFETLASALEDKPSPTPSTDGAIFRAGFDERLDELRELSFGRDSFMKDYAARLARETDIPSLKVGYNRVHGFYIEITNAHKSKAPEHYQRRQTLKNAERYITTELKEYEEKILNAEEEILGLEAELLSQLKDYAASSAKALQRSATTLAKLDVLSTFAEHSVERGYVRPTLRDDTAIRIIGGRHPVLDANPGDEPFVPNDAILGGDDAGFVSVITGPNMAGKSTYIRQVALLILMAQVGCYVPAESADVGIVDRIFTRIGSADELARGLSTFMVEMVETANILNNATERSLIVLDEVGRGTSTYDGVSIAWAITEHIHDRLRARTLFATHYHELTVLSEQKPGVTNLNVAVKEWQDEIIFLRKIVAGSADKSYGIQVARLAGVPKSVIRRARVILGQLEDGSFEAQIAGLGGSANQLSLFSPARSDVAPAAPEPDPVAEELRGRIEEADVNHMTPMDALLFLNELRKLVDP